MSPKTRLVLAIVFMLCTIAILLRMTLFKMNHAVDTELSFALGISFGLTLVALFTLRKKPSPPAN